MQLPRKQLKVKNSSERSAWNECYGPKIRRLRQKFVAMLLNALNTKCNISCLCLTPDFLPV